jgi:hypothetical protein
MRGESQVSRNREAHAEQGRQEDVLSMYVYVD